jgi:cytochrome P450
VTDGSVHAGAAPATPLAAVTHADPYPYYAALVANRPLGRDDSLGLWVAASAEAVTAVLTSERCRVRPVDEPVPRALLGSTVGGIFGRLVRMNDGPRHAALKPAVEAALADLDAARVRAIADGWAHRIGNELAPVVDPRRLTEFMFALPASVTAEIIGVPARSVPAVASLVGPFVRALAPGADGETVRHGDEAARRLLDVAHALPAADGALTAMLGAGVDREAVLANAIGFLSQSYDATAGLTGNTLVALARSPQLRAIVRGTPGALPPIVAEVARHDAPVQNTRRFVAEDGVVGGAPVRAGDAILVVLAAANRDPAANPDPARFDHERAEPRTFTFGLGPHACPGATLAVTIASAGVTYLLEAGMALDDLGARVTYRPSPNARIPTFGAL